MKRVVIAKLTVEALHSYPDAPEEVAYLRDHRRHAFDITVGIDMTHDNREVEIFMLRNRVIEALGKHYPSHREGLLDFGHSSCEELAGQLLGAFNARFVEMWEEQTAGARVER